jgi:LmbE family N-acetylglucosaminyl deacetylase
MTWIYLSPHFDDIALSCGGQVWEQAQAGQAVSIWTICGGEPPDGPLSAFAQEHHERWGTGRQAVAARREEDIAACKILSAAYRHFDLPDCLYRRVDDFPGRPEEEIGKPFFPYDSHDALFGSIHPAEERLVDEQPPNWKACCRDAEVVSRWPWGSR